MEKDQELRFRPYLSHIVQVFPRSPHLKTIITSKDQFILPCVAWIPGVPSPGLMGERGGVVWIITGECWSCWWSIGRIVIGECHRLLRCAGVAYFTGVVLVTQG